MCLPTTRPQAPAYEAALAAAPRPCFVAFRSSRPEAPGPAVAAAEAWAAVLAFIRAEPARAKGLGELFAGGSSVGWSGGRLGLDELGRALVSMGVNLSARQLGALRVVLDRGGDGAISLDDFTQVFVQGV